MGAYRKATVVVFLAFILVIFLGRLNLAQAQMGMHDNGMMGDKDKMMGKCDQTMKNVEMMTEQCDQMMENRDMMGMTSDCMDQMNMRGMIRMMHMVSHNMKSVMGHIGYMMIIRRSL